MTINELMAQESQINEDCFQNKYQILSPMVEEIFVEYFETGGTIEEFNDKLNFGTNQQKVVKLFSNLYQEWKHNIS